MKQVKVIFALFVSILVLSSCTENLSNGERIGVITQFSQRGLMFKTWEGHLNVTQTGMNSSTGWDFSLDRDNPSELIQKTLDSAANYGWKVKLVYHQVSGFNWWDNRGDTNYFINKVEVLDRSFDNPFAKATQGASTGTKGAIHDTIWVVIDKSTLKK